MKIVDARPGPDRRICVGDVVTPKTPAGLRLARFPVNGDINLHRGVACTLVGQGVVVDVKDARIDYDTWGEGYEGIGEIGYRNCLISSPCGTGWAGEGALVIVKKAAENA